MDCVLVLNMIPGSHLRPDSVGHESLFEGLYYDENSICMHFYLYPHVCKNGFVACVKKQPEA